MSKSSATGGEGGFVRRAMRRIAAGEGVLGRLADRVRHPYDPRDAPTIAAGDDARIRLAIGPNNTAGQAYMWARAVEREFDDASAVSVYCFGSNLFRADVDLAVPEAVAVRSPSWHSEFEAFLTSRTHVLWESGLPLLGRKYGASVDEEVRRLTDRGVTAGLMFHGSDIRPPALHAAASVWSPFAVPSRESRALELEAAEHLALARRLGVPCFVSTPDLLRWLPEAVWCPVVVDPSRWGGEAVTRTGPPVVIHAPSNPWIKGTDAIEPMLRRLSAEGVIDYRQIVGVPHASMPDLYAGADVVLDQFALGIYGVAACEAMAAGKVVMSHVDAETRSEVRGRTGWELPVHETTVASLEGELRRFAADPDGFAHLRAAGPAFVTAVHDGRSSAEALRSFLGEGE